jgi:hypothetical protein
MRIRVRRASKDFIRAWHTWRHSHSSYSNAYLVNKDVSTGKVEHALDHMESYLYSIGLGAIEGKGYEYAEIAGRDAGPNQTMHSTRTYWL